MLSPENMKRLKTNGLYKCEPNVKYRGKLYEGNLYHCCNWTFEVKQNSSGRFYMRDTYWSSGSGLWIELTDENFNEFELFFEWGKVKKINANDYLLYENTYRVAVDSGGWNYPKYYVDAEATKSKNLILNDINEKIDEYERELKYLKEMKEKIENDTYNLEWY